VRNPCIVLSEKEERLARVREEIQALLTVIPLLDDDDNVPSWDELKTRLVNSSRNDPKTNEKGMAELELYYPFVNNLRFGGGSTV
jgi:hypothetical protein